jgi:hypothetical protein
MTLGNDSSDFVYKSNRLQFAVTEFYLTLYGHHKSLSINFRVLFKKTDQWEIINWTH